MMVITVTTVSESWTEVIYNSPNDEVVSFTIIDVTRPIKLTLVHLRLYTSYYWLEKKTH